MTPEIISLTGTDGSGKTTLAAAVVQDLRARGYRAEHLWLGAESLLMGPVRWILRRAGAAGRPPALDSPSTELPYTREVRSKNAFVSRYPTLVRVYVALVLLDYRLQFWAKIRRARGMHFIVADRYLFDVIVNLGVTLGWSDERVALECRRRLLKYGTPLTSKYVSVPIEVAMRRKGDIPDESYLQLRRQHYDTLARELAFEYVDGELPPEANARQLVDDALTKRSLARVLYVHANNHDVGGADLVMQRLACYLNSPSAQERRVRAYVMLRLDTWIVSAYARGGLLAHVVAAARPSGDLRPWVLLKSIAGLVRSVAVYFRAIAATAPDVVHVNDVYDVAAAVAAKLRGVPVVYHLRMFPGSPARRLVFRAAMRATASATVAVSEAVRSAWFGPRPRPTDFVAWDIADDRLRKQPSEALELSQRKQLAFVMVGRVEPWKGQHVFLDAVAALDDEQRRRATFTIVGGSVPGKEQYFEECRARSAEIGVDFLGERRDVPKILQDSDVLVHGSTEPDPLPGVVIEGVLAGRYVLAARAGGVPEILRVGGGAMVPPGDASALSLAMHQLIEDPGPVHSMGADGHRYVKHNTAPEAVGEAVFEIYRTVSSTLQQEPRVK